MGYFPFYIDIENKLCIVVGGGKTALRKIKKLIPFNPEIRVISPEICKDILNIKNISIINRKFDDDDIENAFMVVSATDNRELNSHIFEICNKKNILVNTVDDIEKCGFIFPALVKKNDVTIGISTSGSSPIYAKFIKNIIEDELDEHYNAIFEVLKKYRKTVKDNFSTEEKRKEVLNAILDFCLIDEKIPDDEDINSMIERIKENMKSRDFKKIKKIRIGTRKSRLALVQTNMVVRELKRSYPDIETEIITVSTKGDRIIDRPLTEIGGKGIFISEIENMLLKNEIDIAVHSAKDLPLQLAENLIISGVLERGDYRDAVVVMKDHCFENKENIIIGTGSLRRRLNLKRHYNNISFKEIRGNVDTRLKKLENNEYDALILACAGLERLDFMKSEKYDICPFDYDEFLPSPCQGIIAVESRKNDDFSDLIKNISDKKSFIQFETERYILELLNADCTTSIGAYSELFEDKIKVVVSKDFKNIISGTANINDRFNLVKELINKL